MRRGALALVAAALVGGCSLGDEASDPSKTGVGGARAGEPGEAQSIRAWSRALNAGNYAKAASYFADGAIVEQTREIRLPDQSAAEAFNRSLPCRADVTRVEDEGETSLAYFTLRDGPGLPCGGRARVRFTFDGEKFSEWRQLPEAPMPEGDMARAADGAPG